MPVIVPPQLLLLLLAVLSFLQADKVNIRLINRIRDLADVFLNAVIMSIVFWLGNNVIQK
jgi:hypothetical protein